MIFAAVVPVVACTVIDVAGRGDRNGPRAESRPS